jgi:hypothetical protein
MRAQPSLQVQKQGPIKVIANSSYPLDEEPLWVRYAELTRLRQAVLNAEADLFKSKHHLLGT